MYDILTNDESQKYFKAIGSYMAFFGSRYVGNDIQLMCGNIMDHAYVKTFTLYCIMFNATSSFKIATIVTCGFLLLQYIMSISPQCSNYVDKNAKRRVKSKNPILKENKEHAKI